MRFLVLLFCVYCVSAELPHYIKPCARSDPNFNACAVQHANENIKEVLKGDRKNGIPVLNPLDIEEILVEVKGFHLLTKNMKMWGLKDMTVTSIDYDFKNLKHNYKFKMSIMQFIGDYEMSGKLLSLSINGKGKFNCTLIDPVIDVNETLSFETINGKKYLQGSEPKTRLETKRLYLRFTDLFNGNKLLEDNMNLFLDENWKDVLDELGKPGSEATMKVFNEITNRIYKIAPYEEMFPEILP